MSKLVVGTLEDKANPGSEVQSKYLVRGSSKSWVNFDGTGTVAIRDSLNISSITDLGTGSYQGNVASAMGAADYVQQASSGATGGAAGITKAGGLAGYDNTTTTFVAYISNNSFSFVDVAYVGSTLHGDLA